MKCVDGLFLGRVYASGEVWKIEDARTHATRVDPAWMQALPGLPSVHQFPCGFLTFRRLGSRHKFLFLRMEDTMQCPFRKSSLVELVSDSAYSTFSPPPMLHPGPNIYNSVNAVSHSAQRRSSIYLFFGSDTSSCAEYLRPSQRLLKSSAAIAPGRRLTLHEAPIHSPLCLLGGHLVHHHCRRRDCKEPWAFEYNMVPITDHSHADREVIWPEHLRRSERLRCTDWGPTDTCELYLCLAWAASTHSILPNSLQDIHASLTAFDTTKLWDGSRVAL